MTRTPTHTASNGRRMIRVVILALLALALGLASWRGVANARVWSQAAAACDALATGRLSEAVTIARAIPPEHEAMLDAVSCGCDAALVRRDDEACRSLVGAARLAHPGWLPRDDLRLTVAESHLQRHEPELALGLLEGQPATPSLRERWFLVVARAHAQRGDAAAVERTFDRWRALGEPEPHVLAHELLVLNLAQLRPPRGMSLEAAFDAVLAAPAPEHEPRLHAEIYRRYVSGLVNAGRQERALEIYERAARAGFPVQGITPSTIRSSVEAAASSGGASAPLATRRYRFVPTEELADLELSAQPADGARDGGYQRITAGRVFEASPPLFWVARNRAGVVASGHAWGEGPVDAPVDVEVRPGPPRASPAEPPVPARSAGDGRRRVFAVLLDCGEWRIVRHLLERGELPAFRQLLASGWSGVMESVPAYTAAALQSITWPDPRLRISLLALVHQLGDEVAGLASVGRNPWDGLDQVLPARPNLFRTVGAGPRQALNLLFTVGEQERDEVLRNDTVIGPAGASAQRSLGPLRRPLNDAEHASFPSLIGNPLLQPVAAEFDILDAEAASKSADLVVMRIEALDLLTHGLHAEMEGVRQDDGDLKLYDVYRYIDRRLGAVAAALDQDDVLVVFSDHGAATALRHDSRAILIVSAPGLPSARFAGTPDLRGLPRLFADLLDVQTEWPETGLRGVVDALNQLHQAPAASR